MLYKLIVALLCVSTTILGQESYKHSRESKPVFHEISNKDLVQNVFPEAAKVEKVNDYWYKIIDTNNKTIGFAMSSLSYCNNIKGFNESTPVMIITDKKWVIQKIDLLSNWETLGYVKKLERKGFFDIWVGKTLKEAKMVHPDAHTGATYTASAVCENVKFLLNKGTRVLPRK